MFDRYTERARRAIFFARYEASQNGSSYIESGHLLLGICREHRWLMNRLLGSAEAVTKLEQRFRDVAPRVRTSTSVDLPLSNESKRVLAYAAEEADSLSSRDIGGEHLLLGLLHEQGSEAARALMGTGLTVERAREIVSTTLGEEPEQEPTPDIVSMLEVVTKRYDPPSDEEVFAWLAIEPTYTVWTDVVGGPLPKRPRTVPGLRDIFGTIYSRGVWLKAADVPRDPPCSSARLPRRLYFLAYRYEYDVPRSPGQLRVPAKLRRVRAEGWEHHEDSYEPSYGVLVVENRRVEAKEAEEVYIPTEDEISEFLASIDAATGTPLPPKRELEFCPQCLEFVRFRRHEYRKETAECLDIYCEKCQTKLRKKWTIHRNGLRGEGAVAPG